MIRISEKHGVNPAIPLCFYCNQPKNEILLTGRLPGDAEAPQHAVWDMEPCDQCKGYMKQGVILISVRNGEMERVEQEHQQWLQSHPPTRGRQLRGDYFMPNPHRTGGWWVVADDLIRRVIIQPEVRDHILRVRWAFIPDDACDKIGLEKG